VGGNGIGGGEDSTAGPVDTEDVGVTSPGADGSDRAVGRDTVRGDLAGTATGDLGGAEGEDVHEARTTGAHEDQS
jgi:hypothetical protein